MATPFARTTRALAAESARPAWWAWALALVLAVAWGTWFVAGRVTVVEVSRHARLELQRQAHAVAAVQGGTLQRSLLEIGRSVRAGDVLVELDARAAELRLQEVSAQLAVLPARLAALDDEIGALQAARAVDAQAASAAAQAAGARGSEAAAQLAYARELERRLGAQQLAGAVAEIDTLRARSDSARQAALRDALAADGRRQLLDAQARGHQSQARIAELQGQRAALDSQARTLAASAQRLQLDIERLRVRAPVDGVLADVVPLSPGSVVADGQRLATVLPAGSLRLVADFNPATALGRVRPGQAALLRLDGFPWAQYGSLHARVLQVAGEVRDQQLRVELALDAATTPALALQHGLPGTVEVALETVSPALLLLRAAGRRWAAPVATAQAEP